MNEIYQKLILTRHVNEIERQSIGGTINSELLKLTMSDTLAKHRSLPPGFKADDDAIQYSGYIIFKCDNDSYLIRQFGETSCSVYKLISDEKYDDISKAIIRYISLEFKNEIAGIPIGNTKETDRDELLASLSAAGIPKQAYSIDGSEYFEFYGIQRLTNSWSLFYSERGRRQELGIFFSEKEAFSDLYCKLVEDYSRPRKYLNSDLVYIDCTQCRTLMKLPRSENRLKIKCKQCQAEFIVDFTKLRVFEYGTEI